ncbi:MAG TPA: hypothetical protein VEG27_04810 [Usitatibacter sp.]|nr:hypothetical protein [Usitatibacter sp.]
MKPPIVFVVRSLATDWPDIAALDEPGLDREHERFRRGIENWIVQTYVRLRAPLERLGFAVRIADRFERGAICVAHRDDLNRYSDPLHDCFVIGVRADRPRVAVAHIEVVQSPLQLGSPRARLLPHWPQPGLLPREASRGTRVERAVYYGRENAVPPWYRESAFRAALAALGVSLEIRDRGWNDYRNVDVLFAHRDETPAMLANKPASKLVNAWLALVPAVVAPEPAFEALRRSDLDFIATRDAASTVAAVASLARSPGLYRAMVENGRARGEEFRVEAIRARWMDLLVNEALPAWEHWRSGGGPRLARYARFVLDLTAQKLEAKRFRARERREKRGLAPA